MDFVRYVVSIAVDPSMRTAVLLLKQKGPAFLIGKLTFPGGRIETDEGPETAASRELAEETGVQVPVQNWRTVSFFKDSRHELHVLAACSDQVKYAKQIEQEPVFEMNIDQAVAQALANPAGYSPDFLTLVRGALKTLELDPAETQAA